TPFGQATVCREGDALTIVAWQDMLRRTLAVATRLSKEGIEVEVIDPRTLNPFDRDTLIESVKKTGACMVVEEAYRTLGVGAESAPCCSNTRCPISINRSNGWPSRMCPFPP